jgi:hypothetical protein
MMSKSAIRIGLLFVVVSTVLAGNWPAGVISAEPAGTGSDKGAELQEDAPPLTIPEKIDGVFAKAVGIVDYILFTRLFQTEREFVSYTHREVYLRDRGTQGTYQRWGDAQGGRQELTERDIRFMDARGELLAGQTIEGKPRQYSWGKVTTADSSGKEETRLVETVTVLVPHKLETLPLKDGDKFVKTSKDGPAVFAKVGSMRGLLDLNAVLTQKDVESLAQQGLLATKVVKEVCLNLYGAISPRSCCLQ